MRRRDSKAKLAGVALCCAGAILMTLYRGPPVLSWFKLGALEPNASYFNMFEIGDRKVGALCLVGSGLCMASFINLQVLVIASWDNFVVRIFHHFCVRFECRILDRAQTSLFVMNTFSWVCVEFGMYCVQAPLLKQYPAPVSVIAFSYFFGALIMGAASYLLVHDHSVWIVRWNFDLIVVLYNVSC